MDDFVDTSVLVAAYDVTDQFHRPAFDLLNRGRWAAATHSLAEVFSVLTGKRKIPADTAATICKDIETRNHLVDLVAADILTVARSARARGIRGAGIYDALLLQAAAKAKAKIVWSFDADFARLSQGIAVKVPPAGS